MDSLAKNRSTTPEEALAPSRRSRRANRIILRLVVVFVALLSFFGLVWMTGLRPSRLSEVKAWEEHVAKLKAEVKVAEAPAREAKPNGAASVAIPSNPKDTSSDAAGAPAPSPPPDPARLAEAINLVRAMFDFWNENMEKSPPEAPGGRSFDSPMNDVQAEPTTEVGPPTYYTERVDILVRLNKPNQERMERLTSCRDVWPGVERWAKESFDEDQWYRFHIYLMRLALLQLRPFWQAGDTAGLAKEIVGLFPYVTMLTDNYKLHGPGGDYAPPRMVLRYVEALLKNVTFKRTDWIGLDWSPLLKFSRPVTREDIAFEYDARVARRQADIREETETFKDRLDFSWYVGFDPNSTFGSLWRPAYAFLRAGAMYDELTAIRKMGFETIMNSATIDQMKTPHDMGMKMDRAVFGEKFEWTYPMDAARLVLWRNDYWILDVALRLIRGDSLESISAGSSVIPSYLGELGFEVTLKGTGPGEPFFVISAEAKSSKPEGDPLVAASLSFRAEHPLPQLGGSKKIVLSHQNGVRPN